MLNDRDRDLRNHLERHLEHEDPDWVRQFAQVPPPRSPRHDLLLDTLIGLSAVLLAVALLLGSPAAVVIFGSTTMALVHNRYRR